MLATDLKELKTFLDKSFGLLRQSNPRSLLLRTRFGIHTFFLKEPIDVLILNDTYRVVKVQENLKPNLVFIWNPLFNIVLELPKGIIAKSKTTVGDTLKISVVVEKLHLKRQGKGQALHPQ